MLRNRVVKRFDSINVIPFIDIMLVLLAIVLTTASFISYGQIKIDLPVAESASKPDLKVIEISIDKNKIIYIDKTSITLDKLRHHLKSVKKENPIILRVDASSPFSLFVSVIDVLKNAKLEKLSILTIRPA